MGLCENRFHHRDKVSSCGEVLKAQHPLQLLKAHHCGSSPHESHDGRMRQEVNYETQPEVDEIKVIEAK